MRAMKFLTEDALLTCKHGPGVVGIRPTQALVTIAGRAVLVRPDPVDRPIAGCPMLGPGLKPCRTTKDVRAGYSAWIQIEGRSVCLDTVVGLTDGDPIGTIQYRVIRPGQELVEER